MVPGNKPEHRERVFEPFFTTKPDKGTGLGLWVAKGVVAKHDGTLRMRSSTHPARSGTVFSIFLPAQTWSLVSTTAAVRRQSAA
jgi:signal transduction histidine kinase